MSADLSQWQPRTFPPHDVLQGRFVRLEPLDAARHGDDLWQELQGPDPALWDYLPYGPFTERAAFDAWLAGHADSRDPQCYAVVEQTGGRALGLLAYLRITPKDGCIELGHIAFGAALQRTPGASEAVFLLARHAFDELGYRRLEWKCNARNARSMRAAERFGFVYEGLFRQHMIVKGENRDTAWYSLIDGEWPACRAAFQRWLAADNFDAEGRQKHKLEELRNGG
ncbi:Protein N-acetyltransferase, RimJ/RimL family [Aquipseudomonas alcaligenes]|uniref:GNAT family N-acetyltransferase n=1 Tax=Aquipseudomonas alcaligenes TaxID=43263 RepID=UPI000955350E|nr:GNAT family protein [Pseudomonas alcaligenes]SIS16391.1 Protein N-acetyltransferase, RimJ/RimL family [Pseudomonas alcaligenes]